MESVSGWESILTSPECQQVLKHVNHLRRTKSIYPNEHDVFRAFEDCPFEKVRVVILGQDPYPKGQAIGRAFAVSPSTKIPRSLKNIFKEVLPDDPCRMEGNRTLESWARQGVFLLNTALTVEDGRSNSHAKLIPWKEAVTIPTLQKLSDEREHLVFMLWGGHAQSFEPYLDAERHLVLKASHPSPLGERKTASPFRGCGHFLRANDYLHQHGIEPINWTDADGNAYAKIPRSA